MTTRRGEDSGFTIVELAVTMGIAMSVMASILGILVSQSNAERRVSTFADNQEILRQAIVAMQRDIRSAEPLEELPEADDYATQIKLNVYEDISAPAVPIRWFLDLTTGELRRELLDSSNAVIAVTYRVPGVANDFAMGNHLFVFYTAETSQEPFDLGDPDTKAFDIAHCTVRIQINLRAAPNRGPEPHLLSSDAQLRNRLPGGIGCATATP